MAFKGDLKNISLFDVLQTLHQNRQTGVLVVQRDIVTKKIYIAPEGVRIFFTRSFRPLRLGEIFVRRGRITTQDVEIILLQQKQAYRPMGELLVESGKVTQEEVDHILYYHAEDEIYEVFGWDSGTFSFYDGQNVDEGSSTPLSAVLLDPASLCLEAARRLDEMERMRTTIPDNETYYVRVQDLEPDREQNTREVLDTFNSLREPNCINDLRDLVGLSLYEVLGTVAQLVEGGLIRPLDARELLGAGHEARDAGDRERAAEMLEKAHLLDPANQGLLEQCIEAVQRLDQPKRLAIHLRTLGLLHLADGRHEEAVELLERAVRQDSDNQDTLVALRDAFAEMGDAEHTAETSLKMARGFADDGNLDEAIESCNTGLRTAPISIALRYHLAQLLARADRGPESQAELYSLIRETESSPKAMRSKKAHDLLSSCYRLLLRIDPEDEDAHKGMRSLDRMRMATVRRKRLIVQGGIAAALLAVVGVVGLGMRGPSARDMLRKVQAAYDRGDPETVRALASELVDTHPESEETQRALALRHAIDKRLRTAENQKHEHEKVARREFSEAWEEVRAALNERPYIEALSVVQPYLERLNRPQAAFLRPGMKAHFEYEFSAFLDRVVKQFNTDRQQVALGEHQLRRAVSSVESLQALEGKMGRVRARNWSKLIPQMLDPLLKIAAAPQAGKAAESIEGFRKMIGGAYGSFANLDNLYFTVRRTRLKLQITQAVSTARDQRLELLRHCRFKQARDLYEAAFRMADAVTDEEPREHFRDLVLWLEQTNTRQDMRSRRDEIDGVVSTLQEIERLLAADQAAAAYRLFRPLVLDYPVIQFERKYKMPYMVRSTPCGGTLYLNGKKIGHTPIAIELDIVRRGGSEVVVKRAGFSEASARLTPTDPKLTGELVLELTKETAWERTISGRVEARPVLTRTKGKTLLLVATSNANLLAIDAVKGGVEWEAETHLLDRITAAPVVVGGHAYLITVGGLLHRVRLADGQIEKTKIRLPGQVTKDAAVNGTTLYVATQNRHLVAVRGAKVVYDKPLALVPATRLMFADGRLWAGTAEGRILVHDAKTGAELRQLRARGDPSFLGGIEAHKGLVVAGAENGFLYAFDMRTGKSAWTYRTAGPVTAPPVSTGKTLFLSARDGWIHTIDKRGKPGICQYDLQIASDHAPVILDGFLYAASGNRVMAFDTGDAVHWWDFTFETPDGEAEHVVAGEGVVVAVTSKSRIVAFPRDKR